MTLISVLFQCLLISMPGGSEWMLIAVAFLVLFGAKKIPEMMKGVGKGIREFNDAKNDVLETQEKSTAKL